jgi:hypothetical protein
MLVELGRCQASPGVRPQSGIQGLAKRGVLQENKQSLQAEVWLCRSVLCIIRYIIDAQTCLGISKTVNCDVIS